MRLRALSFAASLIAFAGCGEGVPPGGTTDGTQAVVGDGGAGGEGGQGTGGEVTLTCADARDSFRACRASAPSCDRLAFALRSCIRGEEPAGGHDGQPPPRPGHDDGDDGTPRRGGDADGDDGAPRRGGDTDDDGTPRRGGDTDDDGTPCRGGDADDDGIPRRGDDGSRGDGTRGDRGGRPDDPRCGRGDDGRCGDQPAIPAECQPIAARLAACRHPCVDEHRAMHRACAGECRTARQVAIACAEATPACTSRRPLRDCLHAARLTCSDDGLTPDGDPSEACVDAIAACFAQADACRAACGDLVRSARHACRDGRHHPHGGGVCGGDPGDDPADGSGAGGSAGEGDPGGAGRGD